MSSEPYVSGRLWGQLGNQLFIISNALALAWDNDATPVFPDLSSDKSRNIPLNREKIFFRLNADLPQGYLLKEKHYTDDFYAPIKYEPNIELVGYSLSLSYFNKYKKRLQKIFAPSAETEKRLRKKYASFLHHPCTVGIQIRVCSLDLYPFCGWEYFKKAMDYFPSYALFIVSSDRIDWVKQYFPTQGKKVLFLEGNDHVDDFFMLTKCKHCIISNSTYGYWAAYLNQNPNKIVIAPSLWYGNHLKHTRLGFPKKCNIYPPEWKVLQVPLFRHIAHDIHGFSTTSVEGG